MKANRHFILPGHIFHPLAIIKSMDVSVDILEKGGLKETYWSTFAAVLEERACPSQGES